MNDYLPLAIKAAVQAGKEILQVYGSDITVQLKEDQSPLTEADRRSHQAIKAMFMAMSIPLLSEEGPQVAYAIRKGWNKFWLIDALDGTKEFIKRNGEFTVNIALMENGFPVMGVVFVPVKKVLYFGAAGLGSYRHVMELDKKVPGIPSKRPGKQLRLSTFVDNSG